MLCTEGPESPGKRGRSLCARGGLVPPHACPSPQEMLPDSCSVSSAGSRVGGYDDTSSDHSPANAADPPATSANSPATPSPAPTAAGTHASTGNCRLRSRSRGPGRHWRASLPTSSWESSCPPLGVCTSEQPRSEMNWLLFCFFGLEIAPGNKSSEQCKEYFQDWINNAAACLSVRISARVPVAFACIPQKVQCALVNCNKRSGRVTLPNSDLATSAWDHKGLVKQWQCKRRGSQALVHLLSASVCCVVHWCLSVPRFNAWSFFSWELAVTQPKAGLPYGMAQCGLASIGPARAPTKTPRCVPPPRCHAASPQLQSTACTASGWQRGGGEYFLGCLCMYWTTLNTVKPYHLESMCVSQQRFARLSQQGHFGFVVTIKGHSLPYFN